MFVLLALDDTVLKSCGERQCHLAFTATVYAPISGVGDLWYSCPRLSIHLGSAAVGILRDSDGYLDV